MVSQAPDAIDIVDFQFREHLRLNVFNNSTFADPCNLVSVASRYGLIFIASDLNEFQVVQVKDIESFSKEVTEFKRRTIPLPSRTLHISVNCDSTKLAVVIIKDNCPHVLFYDVLSFLKQNVLIVNHTRLSQNPTCKILQVDWNPALPDVFTVVKDDGTLLLYEFKGAPIELPAGAGATCFCWSPKGKQLAVGSRDGKITQYKIDLKAVKVTEAPPGFISIVSLCWVSSFQFFGVFNDQSGDQTSLICVDAPKTGATVYTNFDDVCYSNGDARPQQFYLMHQLHWNMLFVASSNSMEIAILGMDAGGKWTQWNLNDNSRAALPLGAKHEDTLPVGCAFNVGTTRFKLGDDLKQGPALFVLSDHGMLCMFNAINARAGAMDICSPLENVLDRSGEVLFVVKPKETPQQLAKPVAVASLGQGQGQFAQVPNVPGLTINPVSSAPQQIQPPGVQGVQSSLFGSSGTMFKPALVSPPPPQTQFPPCFGQKPMFAPPVSVVAPQVTQSKPPLISTVPAVATVPTAVSSFQSAPKDVPTTPILQIPSVVQAPTSIPTPTLAKPPISEKLPVTDETEAIIAELVREECLTVEGELHDLLERGAALTGTKKIGTDAEMTGMARKELEIEEFYSAIKENINTHDSEVYTLKQALLQTWACYEEARTRYASSKDPVTKVLLQLMPLDPASQHQSDEISRMMYYIDSQLAQANQCLDEQWDNFQDTLMKSNKLKLPTMESVYQSMVQHSKTLQKQKYMLKHIAARIKSTNRVKDNTLLNVTVEGAGSLEEELSRLQIQHSVPQSYSRLIERQSKLNDSKVRKLQDVLCNKEASRVCVSKPQLNNSTVQLTTLLATPLSPICKKPVVSVPAASGGFDKLINSTPKPKALVELKMPKVPVQSFSPTSQAFGFGGTPMGSTSSLSSSGTTVSGTNLFGKPATGAFNFNAASAATTVASFFKAEKTTPTSSLFSSASVMSVPGTGNTSSAASTIMMSSAEDKVKPTSTQSFSFQQKTPATTTGAFVASSTAPKSAGLFGPVTTVPVMPKSTKPALLATPTTPPVNVSSMFGTNTTAASLGSKSAELFKAAASASSSSSDSTTKANSASTSSSVTTCSLSGSVSGSSITSTGTASTATLSGNSGNIFGPTALGKTGNIFGASAGQGTGTATSIFSPSSFIAGGPVMFGAASSTTGTSMFGSSTGAAPAPAPVKSMFPSAAQASSTVTPTPTTVSTTCTTFFGAAKPAVVTTAAVGVCASTKSIFGTPAVTITTATTSVSVSTPPTTTTSIFGATAATTTTVTHATTPGTGIGASTVTVTASATSAFGSTAPSIFASAAAAATASTTPTPTSPFGIGAAPGTTAPPAYSAPTSAPLFGTPATSVVPTSVFNSTQPAFGSTSSPVPTTAAPAVVPTVTAAPPAFASNAFGSTPITSAAPAFGATPASAAAPAFGTGSVFGGSAFGSAAPAPAPSFGSPSPFAQSSAIPSQAPAFASTPSTTASPFGATSSAGFASSGNLFAQPAGKFASGGSIFGGGIATAATAATTTSTPSTFGTSPSVFGNAPSTTTPFGSASTFGAAANSPFAQAATTQGQAQPQSPTGAFGSPSTFGSANSFGGPGTGAQSPTGNAFSGFGSLSVGSAGNFGQAPAAPAANPFGAKPQVQEQKSPFGSTTGNLFAAAPASSGASSNVFGSRAAAPPPSFGASSGFGAASFGQPSSFGNTSFGSAGAPTPAGAFSGGSQSVAQTGFGSPSFQKPAFGSAPVFGQQPAFGGNASFGAAPSFGGGAMFGGNPGKVFGGGAAEPVATPFGGGATAQSSTFGSIAQQNTVGFGNLAQQAATPSSTLPFSGGSSFTNWRN